MDKSRRVVQDIDILPAAFPIPGMGTLPVNAFVIRAKEPVLVDTGMGIDGADFMAALESVIDPGDLKWIWLTHDDHDHTGNLKRVLDAAPGARLAAHALAVLRISSAWQVPMDRVYWLSPGDSIDVGNRKLTAVRPPLFDNPTTIGIHDSKSGTSLSADFCGALISKPAQDVEDIPDAELEGGMVNWAGADSPWVHSVEPGVFRKSLDTISKMAPKNILSAHLPPALGKTDRLLDILAGLPASAPFVAPGQEALRQLLAA